ncbi:sodium/solute symporter [Niabella sp. CC-SYL272]|uniref:sodium:solute symporter family transporter n=1 Tax=Niabella agricola TaxID=2891571 RepID=UPI001EEB414A|nr:sodium/solute symporter [Niabella agricola]MCF3108088.1 sodium/solute symporter [Niabella agricola]
MGVLSVVDYIIFLVYFLLVALYGIGVYRKKQMTRYGVRDYFLAEGSLTWWAIGASLIASNISAEQFIGMSGAGFKMGLAIASYEWMSALTLIVVAIFFIPVYLKNKIYTMPQFLSRRYNNTVAMVMAVFWLLLYVVVNLTSILYLGALAINSISGININICMVGLAIFAIGIALGGMQVIGYTDVIQVFFLIFGGLVTTGIALNLVASHNGSSGIWNGLSILKQQAPDHFHMIFDQTNPNYMDLPGLSVLIGGLWIANMNYWGCNQYITQRALGADLKTARNGILFASFLKLLMPLIVVLPGIAAFVLFKQNLLHSSMINGGDANPDQAYPVLLNLLPQGLKGLSFAALTAAVVASLAGKVNSIATIFTLDVYHKVFNRQADDKTLVLTGKITLVAAMLIAVFIAPHLGIDKKGGFQYIQEYTGFVSPGILATFVLGFFWKRATAGAAMFAIVGGFMLAILLKALPLVMDLFFLHKWGWSVANTEGIYEIPFLDRMFIVFVICLISMVIISLGGREEEDVEREWRFNIGMFRVTQGFAIGSILVIGLLAALFVLFW